MGYGASNLLILFSIAIFQKFFVWQNKIFHREVFNLLFHCDLDSGMQVEKTLTELFKKMETTLRLPAEGWDTKIRLGGNMEYHSHNLQWHVL